MLHVLSMLSVEFRNEFFEYLTRPRSTSEVYAQPAACVVTFITK
jgi:hypothetical protein